MRNEKPCETFLLDDLPAETDAFASDGDTGPHQRVADAVADMIESAEVGGKAIGLEGGWGSGKSTVVRFLSDRFSKNDDYTVVLFDAWAHEGDPLRRTFIESIVSELCEYGWAKKKTWKEKLEELANRRKETTTRITPKPTDLGKAMAISLLLVPLGTALIAGGFRHGVTLGWGLPPNWFFCLGLYLVLSPFLVLLYRWAQLRTKVETLSPGLIPFGAAFVAQGIFQGVTFGLNLPPNWFFCLGWILIVGPFVHWMRRFRQIPKADASEQEEQEDSDKVSDWAFLISRAINETHTETIETPNPTSLEFDEYFGNLMAEALSVESRRLLLVLDNLDRVDAETALSIWGTLQTFLHDRDHNSEAWYRQLWVVVPYDPIRIRKLWNQPEEQKISDADEQGQNGMSEARRTTESFLDKSFQVRFHVAPPVLSDWKSFLYELVEQALPCYTDDRHVVYRVFDHCRPRDSDPPTPRELKLYINQIGAIHRQWQHNFPIGHVAFFVLARKTHHRLIDALRNGDLPKDEDRRLLDDESEDHDLGSSLAGLAFNVKPAKGLELLLADPIANALKTSGPDDLKRIADRNGEGFWAVLESVATTRWRDEDAHGLTSIATQLHSSEFFVKYDGPEKRIVLDTMRETGRNMKSWMPVSDELGGGIGNLLRIQADKDLTTVLLKKFCSQVAKSDSSKEDAPDAATVAQTTFALFDVAKELGHEKSIPKTISLPFRGEQWITACSKIASVGQNENYWPTIRPTGDFDEVSKAFVTKVSAGEFAQTDVAALKVTGKSALKCDWQAFCTAIKNRLDAGQNAPADECVHLHTALFQLESVGGAGTAKATQASLCEPGHLLHHFYQAKSQNKPRCQAAIILSFCRQRPKLKKPTATGKSEAGHQMISQSLSSPEDSVVAELFALATQFQLLPEILNIIKAAGTYHALFVEVLKKIADSDEPEAVLTPAEVTEQWSSLREHLNDDNDKLRFQRLVGGLPGLCEEIQGSDDGFLQKEASLYLSIVRGANGQASNFVSWCLEGLRRLTEDDWKADFAGNCACLAMCIDLSDAGDNPLLANSFADALQDHARSAIEGKELPPEWIRKKWATILDCIEEESTRKVLRERVIESTANADGVLSNEFFEMYGNEISDASSLAINDRVLSHFFTALVREKHVTGLRWLDEFASRHPGFLDSVSAEHTINEFTDRLQEHVANPTEDETHTTIASIAGHFDIKPLPQPEEDGDSPIEKGEEHGVGDQPDDVS